MSSELTQPERIRYLKQLQLPEIGETGQKRLKGASVLIIGAGGLGSPVSLYLAAAGVGRLGLVDSDKVELSNLQRQVIHSTETVGELKTRSAAELLRSLNPEIFVEEKHLRLSSVNANEIVADYQVLVDCTDNLSTRLLINRACVDQQKPMIHGAVYRYEGQVSVFDSRSGPCYQCLFQKMPDETQIPDPATNGLMATSPGVIGTLMANETLKYILGIGTLLIGRLLTVDLFSMHFQELHIQKNPQCPVCSHL
jgi:adenylyltransferase/sulfurtransferase